MKKFFTILFILTSYLGSFAQVRAGQGKGENILPNGIIVHAIVLNGDTMPLVYLEEVRIIRDRVFKDKKQADRYGKLKRDVKKTYPYAIIAAAKLKEYNARLARMPLEAQRKIYMKQAENELKKEFSEDLKNLTITQGRILIKLIDRETGNTSYDLVQELRGSFSAFMWQSLARLFGSNLKSEYDGKGDDKMIEEIIVLLEHGEI